MAFFGRDGCEFDVRARGKGFDAVCMPEVVAKVEFGEPKGDLEFGVVRIVGTEEGYAGERSVDLLFSKGCRDAR